MEKKRKEKSYLFIMNNQIRFNRQKSESGTSLVHAQVIKELLLSAIMPDGEPCLNTFFPQLILLVLPWMAVNATLAEISPAAKDTVIMPGIKSNECRCIYEMQASVYSNNFSQRGLSQWSTLCIDHPLNTSHLSCSPSSNLPQQNSG